MIGVTMNVIGKVINVSPNSNINMADATKRIISQMESSFSGQDDNGITFSTNVNLSVANSNKKIPKSPEKDSKNKASRIGGMSMIRLTVEEMNLLSIYHEGSKAQLMENMTAALPFMDEDMRPFAERTLQKISPLTENEYAELAIFAADEV